MSNSMVDYLNSLHGYNAQNQNAYSEHNVTDPNYAKVQVEMNLGERIAKILCDEEPQVVVLTGHAGDGKTSIMHQTITKNLGKTFDVKKPSVTIELPNGRKCLCIKDFSEFTDEDKLSTLQEAVQLPEQGTSVFMVANTGPLINTYVKLFDPADQDEAEIKLVDAMDKNKGADDASLPYKMCVINVAAYDNTAFASAFLDRVINESCWEECSNCEKKEFCPIARNIRLIRNNKAKVFSFLEDHYFWLYEHGKRLTVRTITEQIAFMITGGLSCAKVKDNRLPKYLFVDCFFGYEAKNGDFVADSKARELSAIAAAAECQYDSKRLRADEGLLIRRDYSAVFTQEVAAMIEKLPGRYKTKKGFAAWLRRLYLFMNIVTSDDQVKWDREDFFSKPFERYIGFRTGAIVSTVKADRKFIIRALQMLYLGTSQTGTNDVQLTLNRRDGVVQNVQYMTSQISESDLSLSLKEDTAPTFNGAKRYSLLLNCRHEMVAKITLPIMNYFDELSAGIISTVIDPQLSHGVESLKAVLSRVSSKEDDGLSMIILKNGQNSKYELEFNVEHGRIESV